MDDKKMMNVQELHDKELEKVNGGGNITWYVVVPGETLGYIARSFHTTVQALFNANKDMLAERGIYTVQEFNAKLFEIKTIRIGY